VVTLLKVLKITSLKKGSVAKHYLSVSGTPLFWIKNKKQLQNFKGNMGFPPG